LVFILDKLNSRANFLKKTIIDHQACPRYDVDATAEDRNHLFSSHAH
jgi:hypothetical protein